MIFTREYSILYRMAIMVLNNHFSDRFKLAKSKLVSDAAKKFAVEIETGEDLSQFSIDILRAAESQLIPIEIQQ